MVKIACFGENCVDINYIDEMIMPGGNCVNVAVYCRELGHEAAYIGTIADDAYGDLIKNSMMKYGIDISMVKTVHGETGVSACRLINGDRTLTMENNGGVIYTDPICVDDEYIDYFSHFDIIHANYWAYLDNELIKIKKRLDVPISYDFSQAYDNDKIRYAASFADYILFSGKKELDIPQNLKYVEYAVDECNVKIAIMTFGTVGAYVYTGIKNDDGTPKMFFKEPYNAETPAIDTTGCGDSWISGFLTTYIDGLVKHEFHTDKYVDYDSENEDKFLTNENTGDYINHLIEYSMCVGNMRARATSQIRGAYGGGLNFEEYKMKYNKDF